MIKSPHATKQSKFQQHSTVLMWKCYLQRQRRWRCLAWETFFASILFIIAVLIAKPVFLIPLEAEPEPPLTTADLLASLSRASIVGYSPDEEPFTTIMEGAATALKISLMSGETEFDLNSQLYHAAKSDKRKDVSVLWVIWTPTIGNTWRFSIRSTERARTESTADPNPHLRAGFLAVQLAISRSIIAQYAPNDSYAVNLVSMPVSPLMQQEQVRKALAGILLCFTIALIPPVLEAQALVVRETTSLFKRSLRMRGVSYVPMYLGWLVYAFLTALPICFVASVALLLIFRWIHLFLGITLLLAYMSAMILTAFIMAMFHSKTWIACVWSILFTLLQTYMAELLVHHEYDRIHGAVTFLLHLLMPPLGLVHAMNSFAMLSTGDTNIQQSDFSLWYSLGSWAVLIVLYFMALMILQRTIGRDRAIGGQVSWKSIIFKKFEDENALHEIENPTGTERDKLQEVDELVAKAVSFRNVSKTIMGVPILEHITMDIYRGEFTMLFAERVQQKMITTIGDLLTGLTFPEHGTITVLGRALHPGEAAMSELHMTGYCHLASFLVPDLTVAEHFDLYRDISMWKEPQAYIYQYGHMRWRQLAKECGLEAAQHEPVSRLDEYYRAQLCWALAMLLEPRVVIVPNFSDQDPRYIMVIRDKIMQYKKFLTVIHLSYSSLDLEYADRVFIFESKVLAFGGTPAYMFFKYGREYRVRMTIRSDGSEDDEAMASLLARAAAAGGAVRAHLGSLLILRLPTAPTDTVASFIRDLSDNSSSYGVLSMHIGVPDSEEVYRRAMMESRALSYKTDPVIADAAKNALRKMSVTPAWKQRTLKFSNVTQLKQIGWKYLAFHIHYRVFFVITFVSAILVGVFIGHSLSTMLTKGQRDEVTDKLLRGEILTIEFVNEPTILVLRADRRHAESISLANAYVLSEPGAQKQQVDRISYNGLSSKESLTEYLVTRAIDSPNLYVTMFAYGMDVKINSRGILTVQALYSPLHKDYGSAARSLAKVCTALLRHFTGNLDASIEVTDDPLELDLIPWTKVTNKPPLFVQFLLILAISHMTLIPSMEYGFVRHMQIHAKKFSPARYWLTLYAWDLVLYWLLVCIMTGFTMLMMYLIAPSGHFHYSDLLVLPFMLILYGFACVPQAYLFSLGPRAALNSMTFVIVNVVFGETTIIAQTFYGEFLTYALLLMRLSPQFNMAYAFVKIKQIFLYNSECLIFKKQNLCKRKTLHKCCAKCGILQACFKKRNYLALEYGILTETVSMVSLAVLYTVVLLILEYKVCQRLRLWWSQAQIEVQVATHVQAGARRERQDVLDKWEDIKQKRKEKFNTFGEYLLAKNLTCKELGVYTTNSVYLGVGKGEVLALSGLRRHGRRRLVELLAGLRLPHAGQAVCMSQWALTKHPHKYSREVSLSCSLEALPPWMSVRAALTLLAVLRGVPKQAVAEELDNIIEALEIKEQAHTQICEIVSKADRRRLHFAAAVVGAPPVVIVDECTAHQKNSVRRAMYCILHYLRRRGHAIITSASSVETHLPMTNRLAIILDGTIFDIDTVDKLVGRYSNPGYTVVLHLKDEVNVRMIFARHFQNFVINDTSEVLVNVQILDDINWATIFERMENVKKSNDQVYSYIVTAIPIDYIYNSIITNEKGNKVTSDFVSGFRLRKPKASRIQPTKEKLDALIPFEQKYDIIKLKELPWSVIFQT